MKKCAIFLVLALLLSLLPAPAPVVYAASQWDLLECDLSTDGLSAMKVAKGTAGAVTQMEGYVNISKTDDEPAESDNKGAYVWLVPNSMPQVPADKPFTAEATLRVAGATTYRAGQFSVRLENRLYPVFLSHDGWIATTSGGGTNKVELDTTVWHDYSLVIDPAAGSYDVYVDGVLTIDNAEPQSYSGGTLLRLGADNDARTNLDVRSVRMGTGDVYADQPIPPTDPTEPATQPTDPTEPATQPTEPDPTQPETDGMFLDRFDSDTGKWNAGSGVWAVQDGVYRQSGQSGGAVTFAGDPAWTDYQVEAEVTPVATGKNIAVMLSGRADGAANRYIGAYNNGKLMIDRRINGSSTVLSQKAYTMELGQTYRLKMVFSGEKISLYVDDRLELEATDGSHAAGMIGLATYNTTADFDNVQVSRVMPEAEPELTVDGPADYQVLQRDPVSQSASVHVSGRVQSEAAAAVQVRVVTQDGENAVTDWTQMQVDAGQYSGSVTVPQGGWYRFEVRLLDDRQTELASLTGSNKWGVGINILCIGQSNMVGQGSVPYTEANDLVSNCKNGAWSHLKDPYSGGGASLVPAMANKLVEAMGLPVGIVPAAVSGTGLHTAHKNHSADRYWMNYNADNPADTATLYGSAVTKANRAGGVELLVWNQGETDGYMGVTEEEYEADMKRLLQRFRSDLNNAALPMFLCQIGTHDPKNFDDAVYTGIRNAQHDLDDGENFFLAATEMEFQRKDTAHFTTPGLNVIGQRVANGILYYYGESDYYRGPYISEANYADGSNRVIDVQITHRGGTKLSCAGSRITGFSVLDGGKECKVESVVVLDDDTLRLTLEEPAERAAVRYMYGLNPDVSGIVKDNTPMELPLENTTSAVPVRQVWDVTNTTMEDYTANWKLVQGRADQGHVTQENGYVTIAKTDSDDAVLGNPGPYIWLTPKQAVDFPEDRPFTVEATVRMGSRTNAGKTAEISTRLGANKNDPNGKLYPIYIQYGTDGWISPSPDGSNGAAVDTTQWHNFGMVVFPEQGIYDLYVDGEKVLSGATAQTYKGADLLRLGEDSEARGDMDVRSVRAGVGDLSEYLGAAVCEPETPPDGKVWDVLDHEFAPQWDSEGFRKSSKTGTITQGDTYVNVRKPNESELGSAKLYHWVVSPAGLKLPRDGFTMETTVRVAGEVDAEANEVAIRMGEHSEDYGGKIAQVFLGSGENGYISANANGSGLYCKELDTTQWHKLTFVVYSDAGSFLFDLYVDDVLTFDAVPMQTYKGGDLVRFGADNGGRCDLDVQNVRLGSGQLLPEGASSARITGVILSENQQKETEEKTVAVTVEAPDFADGRPVSVQMLDKQYLAVSGCSGEGVFRNGEAVVEITVPAGMKANGYYFRAESQGRTGVSELYQITVDREAPQFPVFEPQGFTIEMEDYKYNPTQEFNFPTVVDTKDHPVKNALGEYRYYLFYAPHDAPAGCCVAVSNSLDGPWIEYADNPVVSKEWGDNYKVSHVSSPWVMWNDVYDCWFMYFHGENNVTRYATSDDLINWEYGGTCVYANDFSPTGSGFSEASYAKVFEHEVPGLGNRYIMLLMITGSGTGGHRNIYWAHSADGKDWTPVQTSLLDPMMDAQYKGNFSGPWFMEWEGRYFVICHASSGNIYSFEVGESLDEVIPWGVFYDSRDSQNPDDAEDESAYPDYGRSGAPSFMQDDDGNWHMFYEGGRRLHANIVHATVHTHSWGEWTVITPATCTAEGERQRSCSCGEVQTEPIPATGHSLGAWRVVKAPTATEPGMEERICVNCDYRENRQIPPLTTEPTEPATEPTTEATTEPTSPATEQTAAPTETPTDASVEATRPGQTPNTGDRGVWGWMGAMGVCAIALAILLAAERKRRA